MKIACYFPEINSATDFLGGNFLQPTFLTLSFELSMNKVINLGPGTALFTILSVSFGCIITL